MNRNAIKDLIEWKKKESRQPLFLYGIRGCGKTYLAMDFAKSFFEGILYINLEQNTALKKRLEHEVQLQLPKQELQNTMQKNEKNSHSLPMQETFSNGRINIETLLFILSETFDIPQEFLPNFLVVLDEIMASEPVFQMLLQVAREELPLCILAITSHNPLGETSNSSVTLPSVTFPATALPVTAFPPLATAPLQLLKLYPLQFDEYLYAIGSEWYAEVIKGHYQTNHKIPLIVHNELLELFEDYLRIGGMPAALNEYLMFESTDNVAEIHKNLYGTLIYHLQGYYEDGMALRMKQVLDVVPEQLAKKNQKFQYSLIRKGATFALYKQAIQALLEDSILIKNSKAGEDSSFKLFPADVGMYYSLTGQELQGGLKKDLLDCYVMQALNAKGYSLSFWESSSQAHIDMVLTKAEGPIPVEIKTSDNTRSKSLGIYQNEFQAPYSIKISNRNFEFSNQTKYIPYYAVFCL